MLPTRADVVLLTAGVRDTIGESVMASLPARFNDKEELKKFRRRLLRWYGRNRRELPWRGQRDPYRIWISEIMLQQTRAAVVAQRYPRFLRRFPTLRRLARAPLSAVLAEWSGLGYYRRARYLHQAARELWKYRRHLPNHAAELRLLPGIGRYTAAAIASIAFDQPVAVVDGNVERVLRRVTASSKLDCWKAAETLLEPKRPGDFNQAMMELGAIVCLPSKPKCDICPLGELCGRKLRGRVLAKKPGRSARQRSKFWYQMVRHEGRILLVQRSAAASLMPGMWELPACQARAGHADFCLRHSVTNTDYQVFVALQKRQTAPKSLGGRWYKPAQLRSVPITGLTRKILKRAGFLDNQ